MAKWDIEVMGLDELSELFQKASKEAEHIAAEALYEGAGIMADAVTRNVKSIKTEKFRYVTGGEQRYASPEEKAIVENARHGVAKFRKNGVDIQTSVGYQNAGYANLKGKTVPVAKIANTINHGNSFMKRQPFLRKSFSQNQGAAQAAIENGIQERVEKLLDMK